ncbi:MAG: DEAD/DEAH box helicase family protein [Candidatus Nanohaloarchaea archaeon]
MRDLNLALLRFIYDELGVLRDENSFEKLKTKFEDPEDPSKQMYTRFLENAVKTFDIKETKIEDYDENINRYLEKLNSSREEDLSLRYYQYLAAFFTEFYLDKLTSEREHFVDRYKEFIIRDFAGKEENPLAPQSADELNKLAYWMATGSGKTHVMHLNYFQYLEYFENELSNIILIAPNERLAKQHREKLDANGIPNKELNIEEEPAEGVIEVTDIQKLGRENKEKTINIDDLGSGDNVIFVDEGHKGLGAMGNGGNTELSWKVMRDELSENGLVFEYSATFASSISNAQGYQEYANSIVFDYSYGRFHKDRYGKDYRIYNIDESGAETESYMSKERKKWLITNLLVYYEKLRFFEEHPKKMDEFNIRKPLSIFVGSSVTATGSNGEIPDVQKVTEILSETLRNEDDLVVETIQDILDEDYDWGSDEQLFDKSLNHLRELSESPEEVYNDLKTRLFGSEDAGTLEVHRLMNDEEEIGLTTDNTENYFGIISISDSKDFMDLFDEESNLNTQKIETFSRSLFDHIQEDNSDINFLIGARKFTEGWDSTRPSTMGLLNFGGSKGPLAVQMFGRGVRLEGRQEDGKRSQNAAKTQIRNLETLHVFGVKSSYMNTFKEHLEDERIDIGKMNVSVPVTKDYSDEDEDQDLYVPDPEVKHSDVDIKSLSNFIGDSSVKPSVSYGVSVTEIQNSSHEVEEMETESKSANIDLETDLKFRGETVGLDILDRDRIWDKVIDNKRAEGYDEIILKKEHIEQILEDSSNYNISAPTDYFDLENPEEVRRVENICITVINKLVKKSYRKLLSEAEERSIELERVDGAWLSDHTPDTYDVKVDRDETERENLARAIKEEGVRTALEEHEITALEPEDIEEFKLLYQPIPIKERNVESISPEGLDNEGERKFVEDLREYIRDNNLEEDLMLMRNQSLSGVGFESAGGYYPDFLLWVSGENSQDLVFIDPKGLVQGNISSDLEKVKFGESIKQLSDFEGESEGLNLHSVIVSTTDTDYQSDLEDRWHDTLQKEGYEGENFEEVAHDANVFFQYNSSYIENMLSMIVRE